MIHIKGPKQARYYCLDCHTWFSHPHVEEVEESRGEYWGVPCTETCYYEYCPNCNSEEVADTEDIYCDVVVDEEEE